MNLKIIYGTFVLVLALAGCNSNSEVGQPGTGTEMPQVPVVNGVDIYSDNCVMCHGSAGNAGNGGAKDLQISVLDSAAVANKIKNGGNGMPPFKEKIAGEELSKLVTYVISLRKK